MAERQNVLSIALRNKGERFFERAVSTSLYQFLEWKEKYSVSNEIRD